MKNILKQIVKKTVDFNTDDALFDFNVGYIGTAILAVFFVALGLLFSIQLVSL